MTGDTEETNGKKRKVIRLNYCSIRSSIQSTWQRATTTTKPSNKRAKTTSKAKKAKEPIDEVIEEEAE